MWWVIRDGVCPMVLCPKRGGGIAGSLNGARWSYAPTGRKGIAQGKAKRRPGIRDAIIFASPEKGGTGGASIDAHMFRPFRALANWVVGVPRAMAHTGRRCTQGGASLYPGLSH